MKPFLFIWFYCICSCTILFGQTDTLFRLSKKGPPKPDTLFIQSYREYLTIGIFSATPLNSFTFAPINQIDSTQYHTTLQANISNALGFTVAFRSIYVGFGFRTPLDPESATSKGKTSFGGIGIRFNNPRFMIAVDWRRMKSFYNESISTLNEKNERIYDIERNLQQKYFSISGIYNFNWKKFSLLGPLNYTQRQIKSKVGFLLKAGISDNNTFSDSLLVSSTLIAQYPLFDDAHRLDYLSIKAGPGIGINIVVFKRVYVSVLAFLSVDNIHYRTYNESQLVERSATLSAYTEGRASLGYQSKRFYAAFKYIGDRTVFKTNDMRYENNLGVFTIDFGYRFGAPKWLQKGYQSTFTRFLGL